MRNAPFERLQRDASHLFVRQRQQRLGQADLIEHVERGRVHGVAAKVAVEILRHFQQRHVDAAAGEQQRRDAHRPVPRPLRCIGFQRHACRSTVIEKIADAAQRAYAGAAWRALCRFRRQMIDDDSSNEFAARCRAGRSAPAETIARCRPATAANVDATRRRRTSPRRRFSPSAESRPCPRTSVRRPRHDHPADADRICGCAE